MSIRSIQPSATKLALASLLILTGCAGDLGAARDTAKKGAAFVGDMHKTTTDAISVQRQSQQAAVAEAAALSTAAEMDAASNSRHLATWVGDKSEDSQEMYQAMLDLTPDADLQKTAPFVVMEPLPVYNTPSIDDKTFQDVIARFNKLSKGLSPMDRAQALIPFIQAAVKAYNGAAKDATDKADALPSSTAGVNALLKHAAKTSDLQKSKSGPAVADSIVPMETAIPDSAKSAPERNLTPDSADVVRTLMDAMAQ